MNGYLISVDFKTACVLEKIRSVIVIHEKLKSIMQKEITRDLRNCYMEWQNYSEKGTPDLVDGSRKLRILVIGRSLPEQKTGMIGIFEFEQTQELCNHGINADYMFCDTRSIFRIRQDDFIDDKIKNVNVVGSHYPIGRLPYPIFSALKTKRFIRIYEKYVGKYGQPSIIHIHFPSILLTEAIMDYLENTGVPVVATEHYTKVLREALNRREKKLLIRQVERFKQYICVSEALKKSVIEMTATKKSIMVIPNIVSMEKLDELDHQSAFDGFTFIVVCRLVKVKRVEQVVRALSILVKKNMNVRLVIAGDGPRRRNIESEIEKNSLRNYVIMKGMLPHDVAMDELKKADAYVSASTLETFGVPFVEAMACGKPVIAADNSPILPYVGPLNGIVFKRNNVQDLARAMEHIYINRNDYDARKIRDFAAEYFSADIVMDKLKEIYEEVQR